MKTIWVDVETTGFDPQTDRIIELAAIYNDAAEGTEDVFHAYCRPFDKKPEGFDEITKITGIAWNFLVDNGITDSQLYRNLVVWLERRLDRYDRRDKALFAAYNAGFDDGFTRELFVRNDDPFYGSWFSGRLDIMSTAVLAERMGVLIHPKNRKNATIAAQLRIPLPNAHNALGDILASRGIEWELERRLLKGKEPL